jgi:hypothetical protein
MTKNTNDKIKNISDNINLYAIAMSSPNFATPNMANLLNRLQDFNFAYAPEWEINEKFSHFVEFYICEEEFCKIFLVENIKESPLFHLKNYKKPSKKERSKPSFDFDNHIILIDFQNSNPSRNENYVQNLKDKIENYGICFDIKILNLEKSEKKQKFLTYYLRYLENFQIFFRKKTLI